MGIRSLGSLKKEKTHTTIIYKRYLFVGEDFYTLNLLQSFLGKYNKEEVAIVNPRPIGNERLSFLGPGQIRGGTNIHFAKLLLKKKLEELQQEGAQEIEAPALFYKDQDFRSFDGRHKPQPFFLDEDFFGQKSLRVNNQSAEKFYSKLLNSSSSCTLDEINNVLLQTEVVAVKKNDPDNFATPAYWIVELANGQQVHCEYLFWGRSPYHFLEVFSDKKALSGEFIESCEKTKSAMSITVRFYLKNKISERAETFLIPLSITNETGHLIAEFNNSTDETINNERCVQYLDCTLYTDPNHSDEESISRNIRALRKNLERPFPQLEKNILSEYISISSQIGCRKIDDDAFFEQVKEMNHLLLVGENAPLQVKSLPINNVEDSFFDISMAVRGLLSVEQIQDVFLKNQAKSY